MIVFIDPGHGQGNRAVGAFDPGAVHGGWREADIVLDYALGLRLALHARGMTACMSREDSTWPAPLAERVKKAIMCRADVIVSLHCNAAEDEGATGTETLWRKPHSQVLASRIQAAAVKQTGLRNRGTVQREDLAILASPMPSCLVELGFLSNPRDRMKITSPATRQFVVEAIADVLQGGV